MTSRDNQPPELTPDWTCDPRPDPFSTIHSVDVADSFAAGMSRDEPMQIPRNITLGEN